MVAVTGSSVLGNCQSELGLAAGEGSLSASSSYDPLNVGPGQALLNVDLGGGAWCPEHPVGPDVSDQWIGVNTTLTWVVSSVSTQGRYAGGQGQEYVMAYRILYWRQGMPRFREYMDSIGRNVRISFEKKMKKICLVADIPWKF